MKTLLATLSLFLCACGSIQQGRTEVHVLPTRNPVYQKQVNELMVHVLEEFANNDLVFFPDYVIYATDSIMNPPGDKQHETIAVCFKQVQKGSKDKPVAIVISSKYLGSDSNFLFQVLSHEVGHCSWNLPHTKETVGEVMSPLAGELTPGAWDRFYNNCKGK